MNIQGQAVLITGGASGLVAETARQMATADARVAVLDLNREAAEALTKEIGGIAALFLTPCYTNCRKKCNNLSVHRFRFQSDWENHRNLRKWRCTSSPTWH